ncbi:MAG: 4-hydroxythreonine-4-phosphate dehydrogenase PdxA [Burkholderiaceae bacterium]
MKNPASLPIAVTMGEPAGVGTEITLSAWLRMRESSHAFFLLHDPAHVAALAQAMSPAVPIAIISRPDQAQGVFAHALPVLPVTLAAPVHMGQPDRRNAQAVITAIRRSVDYCATGQALAMVTNPIQKSILYEDGFPFPGHTEFLEHLAGDACHAVMMLACSELRVVPVSIHESLASAVSGLRGAAIVRIAQTTASALARDFGIARPRIAVAGLNPHAGEGGSMGREDIDVIAPAIAVLRASGMDASGPFPPDTLFTPRARQTYDAAICMYHDQALIPIKTLDVDGGVNVTLGLPFVRTSPDHGTALDIAGKGIADAGSLISAIRMAAMIAAHRQMHGGVAT